MTNFSFIQFLQITINKKETDDDQMSKIFLSLKNKKGNEENKTYASSAV